MQKLFLKIFKKLSYVAAFLVVLVAVLMTVSRLLVPVLDAHRQDFEKLASDWLKTPVTIKEVRLAWYRYYPELTLNEVTVLDQTAKHPLLQLQKIRVFISLLDSLRLWKPSPNSIMISGAHLDLKQTPSGEFFVQGFPEIGSFQEKPDQNQTKSSAILAWLYTQPHLMLENIDINFTPHTGIKRYLTLYHLSLGNSGEKHILRGKAMLHQAIPTEMNLMIQWQGMTTDLAKMNANIYFYLSGVTLTQWLQERAFGDFQVKDGIASAKVWLNLNDGHLQKIQSLFQIYGLKLFAKTNQSLHVINRLSGNLGWQQQNGRYILAGEDILIDLPNHLWPITHFYAAYTLPEAKDAKAVTQISPEVINVGYLDIQDVAEWFFSAPKILPEALEKTFKQLQLTGNLQNVSMTFPESWQHWQQINLAANFNKINLKAWEKWPGLNNFAGSIKWNGKQGTIILNTQRASFNYPTIFANPLALHQLQGSIAVKQTASQDWNFLIDHLSLLNDDAAVNAQGSLTLLQADFSPVIDLKANMTMQKAKHISRYLPLRIFDPELVDWLKHAFISGEVPSAHLELKGKLTDFPFDQHDGIFSIVANVRNVELHYAPDWPNLQYAKGRLAFLGRSMTIDVDEAEILNIPIKHAHAVIPYFGDDHPQTLTINSDEIQTSFVNGVNFLHKSPLEEKIGKIFTDARVDGNIQLKLGLVVPLKHPKETQVQGKLELQHALFNMLPWRLMIDKLNGDLSFTEDTISARHLTGRLFNQPLSFNLTTIKKTKDLSIVQTELETKIAVNDLEKWLDVSLAPKVTGATHVKGKINFSMHSPIELNLNSSLTGIHLDLPAPYAKPANQARDFSLSMQVAENKPIPVQTSYADLINAALILDRKDGKFNLVAANLHLGLGKATSPAGPGLYLSGQFDTLDWDTINQYRSQSNETNQSEWANLSLKGIDIRAKVLNLFNQQLRQVSVQVTPKPNAWDIRINSTEVTGHVLAPKEITKNSLVVAEFENINLRGKTNEKKSTTFDLKTFPSMNITAQNVKYNDVTYGKVNFITSPQGNGFRIDSLLVNSPRLKLEASGTWALIANKSFTSLKGQANSPNVSGLLNSLGYDVHNFLVNKGKVEFDLNWRNTPFSPEVSSMNGTAKLELDQGRIVDVGQTSGAKMDIGKMLSIFSLQTIPRRLSFDFSDVFQKGYTFDYLRGNILLKNGDAFTKDLRFDGPVARVTIDGRIGLVKKDYHFFLNVTPYITSSVPVAATLLTLNPLVGVAAYAVNKVVGTAVSQVTTYRYSVTGPWTDPTFKPVN